MTGITAAVVWLIAAAVFFLLEGLTVELVSVWFGFGSLVAMAAAFLGAPFELQLVLFLLASIAILLAGRPMLKDFLKVRKQPTNADRVVGQIGLVIEPIDNLAQTGRVSAMGLTWTARSVTDYPIPAQSKVRILQIEGVKLIVEPYAEPYTE